LDAIELWRRSETGEWQLHRRASPSNASALDDFIAALRFHDAAGGGEAAQGTSSIVALHIAHAPSQAHPNATGAEQSSVLAVSCDVHRRSFEVSWLHDADTSGVWLSDVESVLLQCAAREVLLCIDRAFESQVDRERLEQLISRQGATLLSRSKFPSASDSEVSRLLRSDQRFSALLESARVVAALAAIADYLQLSRDPSHLGSFSVSSLRVRDWLRLTQSSFEALALLPSFNDAETFSRPSLRGNTSSGTGARGGSSAPNSLYSLLNQCQTSGGSRLLHQWLRQPLRNAVAIRERQSMVRALWSSIEARQGLTEQLGKAPDLERLALMLAKGTATLRHIVQLYSFVIRLPTLISSLTRCSAEHAAAVEARYVGPLRTCMSDLSSFEALVERGVDLEALQRWGRACISPKVDSALAHLAEQRAETMAKMESLVSAAAEELHLPAGKIKLNEAPHLGFHFRVSRRDDASLRKNSHFTVLETRKDGCRFTNAKMRTVSAQYATVSQQYDEAQRTLVAQLMDVARSFLPALHSLHSLVATLDVLLAFALVVANAPSEYCCPELLDSVSERVLELHDARHPCVELQPHIAFVPNDVSLRTGAHLAIVTGPNMSGKFIC
jgi:DNA mismatch repair protein MSH2